MKSFLVGLASRKGWIIVELQLALLTYWFSIDDICRDLISIVKLIRELLQCIIQTSTYLIILIDGFQIICSVFAVEAGIQAKRDGSAPLMESLPVSTLIVETIS